MAGEGGPQVLANWTEVRVVRGATASYVCRWLTQSRKPSTWQRKLSARLRRDWPNRGYVSLGTQFQWLAAEQLPLATSGHVILAARTDYEVDLWWRWPGSWWPTIGGWRSTMKSDPLQNFLISAMKGE